MHYNTFLFDFDYTLANSSRGIVKCFRNVLTNNGFNKPTDDDIKRTIGKTLEDAFGILTGETDEETIASYKTQYGKQADVYMTANTEFFPESKSVLQKLKEQGATIGIISTKYRFRITDFIDRELSDNFFDIIIGGEDVSTHKPAPEGIILAIDRLQKKKSEVIYIGDSIVDAETAMAANVDFAGVTHGVTTAEELRAYRNVMIISTLTELLNIQTHNF